MDSEEIKVGDWVRPVGSWMGEFPSSEFSNIKPLLVVRIEKSKKGCDDLLSFEYGGGGQFFRWRFKKDVFLSAARDAVDEGG